MGKNAMKVGPMTREGAGSSLSEAPPDSPIYKRGWFVGGSTLKNFLSEARKKISEANEIKKLKVRILLGPRILDEKQRKNLEIN